MKRTAAEFVAGSVAEFTKVTVIYPLDLVRNRMSCSSKGVYSSMFDCVYKTVMGEGVRGLYKGILATYISNVGKGTLGFGLYGCALTYFNDIERASGRPMDPGGKDSLNTVVAASLVAGSGASLFECPLEIMSIQLQTQRSYAVASQAQALNSSLKSNCVLVQVNTVERARHSMDVRYGHSGLKDVANTIMQYRSPYLGFAPLFVRNLMWYTATFVSFDQLKGAAARIQFGDDSKENQKRLSPIWRVVCGSMSGVISWTSSFPLEVIKANMMGQPLAPEYRRYDSAATCAKQLYAEGGLARLYRGLSPTIVRALPAYTVVLNTYDFMRHSLGLA